jgi:D-aminopeptidase
MKVFISADIPDHLDVELSFKDQAPASTASHFPGAVRTDDTTVGFESRDDLDVLTFSMFGIDRCVGSPSAAPSS